MSLCLRARATWQPLASLVACLVALAALGVTLRALPVPSLVAHLIYGTLNVRCDAGRPTIGTGASDELGSAVLLVALQASREGPGVVGVDELFNAMRVGAALRAIAHDIVRPAIHACRSDVTAAAAHDEAPRVIEIDLGVFDA